MDTQRKAEITALALLVAGVLAAFLGTLVPLVEQWYESPMYSHAFTVPFISAGLLWYRRDAFEGLEVRPARVAGGVALALSLVVLLAARVAAIQVVQVFAFVLTIPAIVLFLLGWTYLRLSAPAILYLLFMVPFWDVFTEPLHQPFQEQSAAIGIALMRAVGVPAYRDGTVIALSNITLEVARECSGVNYLVAVLALGLPLAYLRLDRLWKQVVLVGSAIVTAALANGLRVAMIGALAYMDIGAPLHGPMHTLHGLFVAGIGYLVIFGGLVLLERGTAPRPVTGSPVVVRWRAADAWGLAVTFWLVVLGGLLPGPGPTLLARPLDTLPTTLGEWRLETAAAAVTVPNDPWAGADEHLHREYFRPDAGLATVDVWYFASQEQGREVAGSTVADLHRMSHPTTVRVTESRAFDANLVGWPAQRRTGLFWYEIGGVPQSGEFGAKLQSAWNALRRHGNGGAAILITTASAGSDADTTARLGNLAGLVHDALAGHWAAASTSIRP